jgi:hypothetical protein
MRRKYLFFLLTGVVSGLLSCATVARQPVLTAELFDSTVKTPAMEDQGARCMPCLAPVAPAGARAAADAEPGYEVSIPVTHAALRARREPRVALLSLPNIPARIAESPIVKKTPPASAAAAASASAPARAPVPAPVTASAPAPTAAPAKGQAGGAPAPSDSYGRLREIYARQGDEVQIGLDGTGFLFLGFPDTSPQTDGMSFKGKENRNNKTWFSFQPLKLGTYDLDFLRQDNSTGKSNKETVRVHVVSDQDFSIAMNQQQGQDQSSAAIVEPGDTAFAERLSGLGANEAAIVELLKGYKDGNPALNEQIASLYMRTGAYDAAGKYYQKNMSPPTPFTTAAVLGMVRIAIAQKDQQGLMSYLKQFLAVKGPGMEETLMRAARMEKEKGETGVALDLAAEYTTRYPDGNWSDEAAFLMAQLLEADSRYRNIARARDIYLEITRSHPESTFASAARERLLYLERHFFEVR